MHHIQHQLLPNALGDASTILSARAMSQHLQRIVLDPLAVAAGTGISVSYKGGTFTITSTISTVEPVCDVSGSVLVNAAGDPVMAVYVP